MHKRLLGLLTSAAIIVAACGTTTTSSAPASVDPGSSAPPASVDPGVEQILNVDISNEPPTLDPTQAQDSVSLSVLRALHRPLVYVNADLEVVPALAESWEVSEDAKTLTFTLRDAMYSNGDPIVASDLVYSWKRLVDPRIAAPYSYVMAEVAGAGALLEMAALDPLPADAEIDAALETLGVAAPDEKTFVVTLDVPATYFLSAMTLWVTVPIQQSWIESEGATEAANYVSSGPFMMESWTHNDSITLVPNPNWYGDVKPTLTQINMSMSAEPAAAMAAYETGEIDMQMPVPAEDVERVQADPVLGAEFSVSNDLSVTYYNYNTASGPTANLNFRKALTQAIDKQTFRDLTFAGLGVIAGTFVMPGIPGALPDYEPYPYDPAAAQESMALALEELGVASAADLGVIQFGFNSEAGHEPRVAFLAQAWEEQFGLQTEQVGSEFGVFLQQRHEGIYGIARNGWGADYPHANNQLNGLFTCGGGNNDAQWCNEEFDALIAEAAVEPDQAAQAALYEEAQKIMADDAASLFLRWGEVPRLIKPYVQGLTQTPMDSQVPGEHFFETISVTEH